MRVTALIGEPCVGKSTVAKALLSLSNWAIRRPKYLAHHHDPASGAALMGVYEDGQQFPGTDRLSMGVHPHMERVLRSGRTEALLWEGDRLSSGKLFRLITDLGHDLTIMEVLVPANVLAARRAAERNQPEAFLQRCRTKIANIKRDFPVEGVLVQTPQDALDLATRLYQTRV